MAAVWRSRQDGRIAGGVSMTDFERGPNLTRSIVEDLGLRIVAGGYGGESAPFPIEQELCRQYGASRPVLREAVKMLTAKGLLGARPSAGTWVRPEGEWNLLDPDVLRWTLERQFSLSLLREFTQVRAAVEPAAAALAAQADATGKAKVRDGIERMTAAGRGEDDHLEADIAFHVAVLQASNNRFYAQLSQLTETALRFSIRRTNDYKGVAVASLVDHRRVADAIAAGNPELASGSMRVLILEALSLIESAALG